LGPQDARSGCEGRERSRWQAVASLAVRWQARLGQQEPDGADGRLEDIDAASYGGRDGGPVPQLVFYEDGSLSGYLFPVLRVYQVTHVFPEFRIDRCGSEGSSCASLAV